MDALKIAFEFSIGSAYEDARDGSRLTIIAVVHGENDPLGGAVFAKKIDSPMEDAEWFFVRDIILHWKAI